MAKNNQNPGPAKWLFNILAITLLACPAILILSWSLNSSKEFHLDQFYSGLIIGTLAQIVDGALGMAYGITSTTFLLSQGIPPAVATGSVHISEIFTTGASGLTHWKLGNINNRLFKALVIPGIIGGVAGAFLITNIDGEAIRPWVSGYLLIMGFLYFSKSLYTYLI